MNQNFNLPYPIYQGPMPNMMQMPPTIVSSECNSNVDMSGIDARLDNLERRVASIENYINSKNSINNNYNSSNYQML